MADGAGPIPKSGQPGSTSAPRSYADRVQNHLQNVARAAQVAQSGKTDLDKERGQLALSGALVNVELQVKAAVRELGQGTLTQDEGAAVLNTVNDFLKGRGMGIGMPGPLMEALSTLNTAVGGPASSVPMAPATERGAPGWSGGDVGALAKLRQTKQQAVRQAPKERLGSQELLERLDNPGPDDHVVGATMSGMTEDQRNGVKGRGIRATSPATTHATGDLAAITALVQKGRENNPRFVAQLSAELNALAQKPLTVEQAEQVRVELNKLGLKKLITEDLNEPRLTVSFGAVVGKLLDLLAPP
jgi:hypothetical protein